MSKTPSRSRRASAVLLASALSATGAFWYVSSGTGAASAQLVSDSHRVKATPADTLGSHDLELLAEAKAAGEKNVTLIVATEKGQAQTVAASLKKLGGKVAKQVDEVGYVRVSVPTGKVLEVAKLPGITAIDLDETLQIPDPRPQAAEGADATADVAGPGAGTPAANAYMPTNETGAVAFKEAHPEWDGRGVTIGIMDTGIDLDHPALQKTTTGERKVVDWVTATDPIYDGDGSWRAMLTKVSGPSFSYAGSTWTAPKGTWLVNRFSESTTGGGEVGGDVNRDGDKTDAFGILYDPSSHDIRVDANQNGDFTDDPTMRPYGEKFDVGYFGKDNPDTGVRERMAFVVEYREDVDMSPYGGSWVGQTADFVNIGIVSGAHGSHVAGITAAHDMLGNSNFDGAAPGAKLVSSRACSFSGGCTAAALTDGMVDLVVNRKVDVLNMSIGGLPALNDANNARARLYDRLITDYGVQMFISAGNSGPGMNTVGDPSVATNVVSVAASVSKDTWLANYGSVVSKENNLFNFSSRGPREDGGLKPGIAAPGSAISSIPMWQAGSPVPEAGYSLPAGYGMFNGTSMAAPQAAGAAALLLSAATAKDVGITPAALRRAIYTSAKPIEGVPTYGQGYGMFDVPGAWKLLDQDVKTRDYTSDAPVCTELSGYLATSNRGTGLYNRCGADNGGQKVGESKTYTVQVTRKGGPATAIAHNIELRGNDGTFSAPAQVVLPLNKTVSIEVTAKPTSVGAHGALMTIDDPATSVIDFEVSATVVVSTTIEKPDYSFSTEGSVQRNSFTSYFVNVPAGASALQVNLSGVAAGSQTRFIAFNPYGVPVESTSSLGCFTNFSDPATCKPEERDYQNPMPGVWEIEVESRRTSPSLDNPFKLAARVQGVKVEPAVVELPSVSAGQATEVNWTVTNDFGPVNVSGKGGPLGSAAVKRPTIANHEVLTYEVTVPAGASRLDVAIGKTSDLGADLDLYVFRNGTRVGYSADGDSEEAVSLANPAAGVYTIEIDGYSVPAGTTTFDYRDVFYSASLGSVSAPSIAVTLANGATGTITGSVTADAAPAAGRQLFGELLVVTDEGATVGRGNVSVGAVN